MPTEVLRIAMIEPLCDYGIGGYTYELAEGLAENGVHVDIYTQYGDMVREASLPRRHRLLPVLGSFVFRQRDLFHSGNGVRAPASKGGVPVEARNHPPLRSRIALYSNVRGALLPVELAWHLKRYRYDLVWTQWFPPEPYGSKLASFCKLLGMKVVHTAHNVLPHEPQPGDVAKYRALYSMCDFLIVHSQAAKTSLSEKFARIDAKLVVAPYGLYTMFPRVPDLKAEVRRRLGIEEDQVALLFFGGIRPYKNLDAVLTALRTAALGRAVLIVAGHEMGYDDLDPGEPLGRTKKTVEALKLSDRVRLVGGKLGLRDTAEIFEAADAVLLPYTESYGSGQLLLAMTYGKFIMATRAGGMDEYLTHYPRHVLIGGPDVPSVAEGIARCVDRLLDGRRSNEVSKFPELEWPQIARCTLLEIARRLSD